MTLPPHLMPRKTEIPQFEQDVISRLSHLEQHVINLIFPIQEAAGLISSPDIKQLLIELNRASSSFKSVINHILSEITKNLQETRKSFESIDIGQAFSEIKYIGNRLKIIESQLEEIKKDGVKRKIVCKINLDGFDEEIPLKNDSHLSSDFHLANLLSKLEDREKNIINCRHGYSGHKPMTFSAMANVFHISGGRVREIYLKSIRKLRADQYRCLMKKLDKDVFHSLLRDIGI